MISIKKNSKMNFKVPKFKCDHNPIGEHLNKYDMLSHLNIYGSTAIVGKPGAGKTSLLIQFLTGKGDNKVLKSCFDHIRVVMPSISRDSMETDIFQNLDASKKYEELNYESITDILSNTSRAKQEGENTLLILDDIGASLKDLEIQRGLKEIIFACRHKSIHIIILLQSYTSLPKEIRKMLNNIFLVGRPSKVEFERLYEELISLKKDDALALLDYVYDKPLEHQYLMLNVTSRKMYKEFDEIILKSNNI
jgi:hypothetical protein